jgi:hypothetical protein
MRVLKVKPNGSCLFIALRLGLESSKLLKEKIPGAGLLDGFDNRVVDSAERLRMMIVDWYSNGLSKTIPGFESNGESTPGKDGTVESAWTRCDLIAMESSNLTSQDIPNPGPERLALALRYLDHMKKLRTWGGAPEYTAFSYMSKLNVEVYVIEDPTNFGTNCTTSNNANLRLRQNIAQKNSLGTVRLLFTGSSHYDLLLSDSDAHEIMSLLPATKLKKL